jgi:hypothetical protein
MVSTVTLTLIVSIVCRNAHCDVRCVCGPLDVIVLLADRCMYFHMSSFNENVGLGYLKTQATEFVKYPCAHT